MSILLRLLLALAVVFTALACNDKSAKQAPVIKAGPGAIAGQTAGGKVRFVTTRFRTQDADLIKTFEQQNGVEVEVVVRSASEIVRAAADKQSLSADVVLVPTLEDAARLRGFGALQPFFVQAFTSGEIGDKYLDNEGYWAGLTQWSMVAVYNPLVVSLDETSSYQGIVSAANRGVRIGVAHPDSSGLAGVVAGIYNAVSPQAASVWTELIYRRANGGLAGNDAYQMERLRRGEIDLAFVSLGAATRWILNGDPTHFKAGETWRIQYPRTPVNNNNFFNMTCLTMPADAPNRDGAVRLINYLYGQEVQAQLSTNWFEYPVHVYAKADDYILQNMQDIGRKLRGEVLEQNIPAAWSIINQTAQKVQ